MLAAQRFTSHQGFTALVASLASNSSLSGGRWQPFLVVMFQPNLMDAARRVALDNFGPLIYVEVEDFRSERRSRVAHSSCRTSVRFLSGLSLGEAIGQWRLCFCGTPLAGTSGSLRSIFAANPSLVLAWKIRSSACISSNSAQARAGQALWLDEFTSPGLSFPSVSLDFRAYGRV